MIGFWESTDFLDQYAPHLSGAVAQDVLADADEQIQEYVTTTSYVTALTQAPPYHLFRRVQAELASKFLASRPGASRQVAEVEKTYADNVKKMREKYVVDSSTAATTWETILSQLRAFKKPVELDPDSFVREYPTMRHFGLDLSPDIEEHTSL